MRAIKTQDWSMIRGDTLAFNVEIEKDEEEEELAISEMTFTCRSVNREDIMFQKTLGNGCARIDVNKYYIRVAPEDTSSISSGIYKMDLQIIVGSDVYTILQGTLNLIEDITL